MQLRGTQCAAMEAVLDAFKSQERNVLIVEPTGWGKSFFTADLLKVCVDTWKINALFVVHTKELAKQTYEAFCDHGMKDQSSLMCAGLGSKKTNQITVGTRQTICRNLDKLSKVNLVIIDECHYMSDGDEYHKIIDHCNHDKLRVLGLTATPYRLKEGWIYGEGKFFDDVAHTTTLDQMIDLGFLSPYRYKMAAELENELKLVKKTAGEFNEHDLGEMMQEEHHMGTVRNAIVDHASDRKSILIFAVTIEHAEKLASFLGCEAVHSKLKKEEWRRRVDDFKNGSRMLVNVAQLTVGFNHPPVDCVVVARPTMSPAIHAQICGRGFRICDGKKDCLILDLVGNYLRHGLPSNPKVKKPKEKEDEKETKEKGASVCPECFDVVEAGVLICPGCGAEMLERKDIIELNEKLELEEVERIKNLPVVEVAGEKTGAVTSRGFKGSWFWVKLQDGKTLFKFCGDGTKKMEKERARVMALTAGDKVDVAATAYGDWIA